MLSKPNTGGPVRLKFNSLPPEIQERLLARQRGEGNGVAIATARIGIAYVLFPLAVLWFAAFFLLTNDFLWSTFKIVAFATITLIAAYLLLHSGYRTIRRLRSPAGAFLLITPHYVIELDHNDVRYWDLDHPVSVNTERRLRGGQYIGTRVTISFENGQKIVDLKDVDEAENLVDEITLFRKLFIEATVRKDAAYLRENDDFYELDKQQAKAAPAASSFRPAQIVIPVLAVILSAGSVYAGVLMNNFYDDKLSWERAQSVDRASSIRYYLQTHPRGRWRAYAEERLQFLYDDAEQKYRASLNEGYDKKAAEAVISVLKYARAKDHCVLVTFERDNQIPSTIVEDLKAEYEVANMIAPGDSFSNAKMSQREGNLFTSVVGAFTQAIPHDVLNISTECAGEPVRFGVKYQIGADTIYYDTAQKKLPESERIYYPGIFVLWDFRIQIPGAAESYDFELESMPAKSISYDGDYDESAGTRPDFGKILEANKDNMYDSMAASAFEDFRAALVFRLGIGDDKKLNINIPVEEETPTPGDDGKAGT